MLVDITFSNKYGRHHIPNRIAKGVYSHSIFFEDISDIPLDFMFDQTYKDKFGMKALLEWLSSKEYVPSYGMCDSWEQVCEAYPALLNEKDKWVISMMMTNKKENGGLNLHKYGSYVGLHRMKGYRYLKDEPNIKELGLFKVYKIVDES